MFINAFKIYYNIVKEACDSLLESISKMEQKSILNKYDLYDYLHNNHVNELDCEEKKYHFHGIGCTVSINGTPMIDWDFGYRSWWCGIDPHKMAKTLQRFSYENEAFFDGNFIKNLCKKYLLEKAMYFYKGQYYIDLLKIGYKRLTIPSNYDRMMVEYKGIKKEFPKCKCIDRFIRKSTVVYNGISELSDNYILIFLEQSNEIARIQYNDIAYPEAAVKIMNGQILKPHIVGIWK